MQYACRKSLADKRPRVRGRFARNDDSTEHPSHMNGHKIEDDDEVGRVMQLIFFSKTELSFLFNTKLFDHNFRYVPHWIGLIIVEQKILRNWTINANLQPGVGCPGWYSNGRRGWISYASKFFRRSLRPTGIACQAREVWSVSFTYVFQHLFSASPWQHLPTRAELEWAAAICGICKEGSGIITSQQQL